MDEWNSSFGIPSSIEENIKPGGVMSSVSYKEWVEQVNHNGDDDQIKLGLQGKDSKKAAKFANKMVYSIFSFLNK